MVKPCRTNSKLHCKSASPVVRVWLNHTELTRNCPVGLLPHAEKLFEEVRCGRTTLNSFETAL